MDSILNLLQGGMGSQLIQGASEQLGMDKAQTTKALGAALPLMMGALKNNASSQDGASSLLNALGNHSSGNILDNLGSILGGQQIDNDVLEDGGKILGHMFGGNTNDVAGVVGKAANIDIGKALNLLKVAAPFVMGYLGRMTQSKGVSDASGLGGLLGGLLGGGDDQLATAASLLQNFSDNDSSIDDIAGMVLGGKSGKDSPLGNIGGMLGGLFGKS